MGNDDVTVSMSRFADFCASDPMSQLVKVREIRRQYENDYKLKTDYWSRWREGVETIHRRGASRDELSRIGTEAQDNRGEQYTSASTGYRKFWGRKRIEIVSVLKPALWTFDRLRVRVNPEWLIRINGNLLVVKLHLKDKLPLNQRLANPLLRLLEMHFGGQSDRTVGILDVHRGRLWRPTTESRAMDDVLRMQAAAFLIGWDASERNRGVA